jgi:hypothetical protein
MYGQRRISIPEIARVGLLASLAALSTPVFSQDDVLDDLPIREEPYRRQMNFTYQYFETDGLGGTDVGTINVGKTFGHALDFEFNQAFKEKWMFTAGLPLITKRYEGSAPHVPSTIIPPVTNSEFLDDGDFHSDLQDLRVGIRYLAKDGPVIVEPFAMLGVPSNHYTFFAQAAVGPNLQRLEIGVDLTYQPPFKPRFFFRFSPGYEFVEEVLGHNLDHWRLDAEVGYFVNAAIDVRLFISGRDGNGLEASDFPPPPPGQPRTSHEWYHHDQTTRHNYVNAGVGVDWALNEKSRLTTALLKMIHADDVHALQYAVSVGVSRSF